MPNPTNHAAEQGTGCPLLPCPCCGTEPRVDPYMVDIDDWGHKAETGVVICRGCGLRMETCCGQAEAEKRWNVRDKDARIAELEKERDEAQAICRAIRKWAMEELGMGLRGFADEIGVKPSDWANVTRESALDLTKMIPLHMKWKEGTTDEEKAAALAEFDAKEGE
jgi:hypothetical protein